MRSLALLGSFLLVTGVQAQSLAEHAAAASGATIGTAAGKPLSNAITKIFGQTDTATKKAASAKVDTRTLAKPTVESAPLIQPGPQAGPTGDYASAGSSGAPAPSRHGGFAHHSVAREFAAINRRPVVESIPDPPRKEPTAEELATIHVGSTEKEVVTALGEPESKVTIPDDGHLVEICQYWAKGRQLGTVRLDNGQVVNVAANN